LNRNEVVLILARCASYDQRLPGDADVQAWLLALGDLTHAECDAAVVAYYRDETEHRRVWPGNIRQRVLERREQYLQQHPGVGPDTALPWTDPATKEIK
jgi:hypothetical protein